MENKKLHSVTGLFDTADEIIHAAEQISAKGIKHYDMNTPFPVHGLDRAMKLKPSIMGYFALAFGLSGTTFALLMMLYMSAIDYPLNIGGKPSFALPAFIPITFELTVLFAAIGTVFALLFILFKMPDNSNPLHDTHYMKHCTTEKFGVCLEAKEKDFDEAKARKMLEELGAKDIETIYYEKENIPPLFSKQFIGFLVFTIILISGTSYFVTNKLMFMVPYNWMMDQERVNAASTSAFFKDGYSMRPKVEGTVPRDFIPDEFQADPEGAGKFLQNPLEYNEENIALGKMKFLTYCSPCHGDLGKGDSRLLGAFPNPPTLHSKKARTWTDGRIYHVITFGQGVMPSYAAQVSRKERWAIIQYIRTLQRALNPTEDDINESK